ncbi:MAG: HAMP domain-containing protein [Phycisphaerae bacterium]|nr:HAMP domain-containing protein [Phycisphaerae bacterium]
MRIRTILTLLLAVQLSLVAILIGLAVAMQQVQLYAEDAEEARFASYKLADELRQSSDDLTRFARTFVATGDSKYQQFFQDTLSIRDGDAPRPEGYGGIYWDLVIAGLGKDWPDGPSVSLHNRMLEAGFTNAEFDKLSEAQNRSDTLVRLENVAMNAVQGKFLDVNGDFTREAPPDRDLAISQVYGEAYHNAKANIMEPIRAFMHMIEQRTLAQVAALNDTEKMLEVVDIAAAIILLLSTIVSVALIRSRLLRPIERLAEVAEHVSSGDMTVRSNLRGTDEIGLFGQIFDSMITSVNQHLDEVESARSTLAEQAISLEEERQRSEHLLLNVLPATIADRLKGGEEGIAEAFPEVSVLFSDIVGFTKMSARVGAKQVVDMLNEVFGLLDELAIKHGVEKIKTIGDCYMVAAGVPDRSPTHTQQIAAFSLEMQATIKDYAAKSGRDINMRTGIHTGTVVAGIVGTTKFSYDLWGDVVNIASRMESTGEPGQIQVSDAVRVRLQDDFHFDARGEVEVRGKGPMHTWYLTGRVEHESHTDPLG